MERENDNSKEDLPPAYFDKYYADNSIITLIGNNAMVLFRIKNLTNGSQGSIFNTDIERQYEYLVKEYPKQAGISAESAEKIHKNNPRR